MFIFIVAFDIFFFLVDLGTTLREAFRVGAEREDFLRLFDAFFDAFDEGAFFVAVESISMPKRSERS